MAEFWKKFFVETGAVHMEWPEGLSNEADTVLRYFDGTAFLFYYKGRLVVTDESLCLEEQGDGTPGHPLGFPRGVFDRVADVVDWLELVYKDLVSDGFDFETMEYVEG